MGDNAPSTSGLNPMNYTSIGFAMTDGQSKCESVELPAYQPVSASVMSVRGVSKTRNAPAGHQKVPIPGPRRFAMGSLPDFVGSLVISTSLWIKATVPSPQNKKLASEGSNQNGSLSQSGMSQEIRIPTSVHPVLLAKCTWFVGNHVVT